MSKHGADPVYIEALSITSDIAAAQVFGTQFDEDDFVALNHCGMVYEDPSGWQPLTPIFPPSVYNQFDELKFTFGLPTLVDTTAVTLAIWSLMPNNKPRLRATVAMVDGAFAPVVIGRTQEPLFLAVHAITTTGVGITGLDVFISGIYRTDVAPLAN